MIAHMLDKIESMSDDKIIETLMSYGIQVVYKPVALLPDNLESYIGVGEKSCCYVHTDIKTALRKIAIRDKMVGDPFSK